MRVARELNKFAKGCVSKKSVISTNDEIMARIKVCFDTMLEFMVWERLGSRYALIPCWNSTREIDHDASSDASAK